MARNLNEQLEATDAERKSNEPLADLLHTILQLFALEEDDEHRLMNLLALPREKKRTTTGSMHRRTCASTDCQRIFDQIGNLRLFEKDVASTDSPEHSFERHDAFAWNDTCDEPTNEREREE